MLGLRLLKGAALGRLERDASQKVSAAPAHGDLDVLSLPCELRRPGLQQFTLFFVATTALCVNASSSQMGRRRAQQNHGAGHHELFGCRFHGVSKCDRAFGCGLVLAQGLWHRQRCDIIEAVRRSRSAGGSRRLEPF